MKKHALIKLAATFVCFLLAYGCASKNTAYDTAPAEAAPMAAEEAYEGETAFSMVSDAAQAQGGDGSAQALKSAGSGGSIAQQTQPQDAGVRKIIYTADLTVTVDHPQEALDALIGRATELGGYVAGSYVVNYDDGTARCTATLKVPYAMLEKLLADAKALGKVDNYQLSSDDISGSYYDIAARLEAAKAEEKQLTTLLETCKSVEEVLKVRESLAAVRADIESYQGQIDLWDELVAYATLELTIQETPKTPVGEESKLIEIWKASDVWHKMSNGFLNSARFVVNAVGAVGIFLAVAVIPCGILFLCIGLPILLHHRNKKKKAGGTEIEKKASSQQKTEKVNEAGEDKTTL